MHAIPRRDPRAMRTSSGSQIRRFWPLGRYPYLVFYIERDEQIDVWRVLHEKRDIPAWMNEVREFRSERLPATRPS